MATELELIKIIVFSHKSSQNRGERKHNILSNIFICGGTDNEAKPEKPPEEKIDKTPISKDDATSKEFTPTLMPNEGVITESMTQLSSYEDELTGLLLATNGWNECQLEMLDSLLDSL